MKLVLNILCIVYVLSGSCQNYADPEYYLIDSLDLSKIEEIDLKIIENGLEIYHSSDHDTSKLKGIDLIVNDSWDEAVWTKYNHWIFIKAQECLKKNGLTFPEKRYYSYLKSSALNNKGYLADTQNESEEAIAYYFQSLEIDTRLRDVNGISQILNNIAGVKGKQGKHEEALYYNFKALDVREKVADSAGMAQSYNNVAAIYGTIGNNDSLEYYYYSKSLKLRDEIDDPIPKGFSLLNVGRCELKARNPESAILLFNKALYIFETHNFLPAKLQTYSNLGDYWEFIGNSDSAIYYYKKSLELGREFNYREVISASLVKISQLYLNKWKAKPGSSLKLLKIGEAYSEEALRISHEIGYPTQIMASSKILYQIYAEQNKGIKAIQTYDLHIKMRDSLQGLESQAALIKADTKYAYEKQKTIDDLQRDKEIAIEKEQKRVQQLGLIAISVGVLILLIFLIIIFGRLKVSRRQKIEIESQKEEINLQHRILANTHLEITDSINYAKRIQTAILPTNKAVKNSFPESFVYYLPKDVVAGDFYWMHTNDTSNFIAVADCTGHGVPGAMVSVVCNNCLNQAVREHGLTKPSDILDKTRSLVLSEFGKAEEDVKDGMDVALISITDKTLQFSGANNPLIIVRNEEIIEIKGDKQPIGAYLHTHPFTNHEFDLISGDVIYIFSDGYADQFGGEKGKKFKSSALKRLFCQLSIENVNNQKSILSDAFINWMGDIEQLDDVCVVGIKVE